MQRRGVARHGERWPHGLGVGLGNVGRRFGGPGSGHVAERRSGVELTGARGEGGIGGGRARVFRRAPIGLERIGRRRVQPLLAALGARRTLRARGHQRAVRGGARGAGAVRHPGQPLHGLIAGGALHARDGRRRS